MKIALALIATLFTVTGNAACPQKEDVIQCVITASGQPNQIADFSVFSSTFLCDGKPNQFHVQEFVLNRDYNGEIYMSWDSIRLSIYKNNRKDFPVAEAHSPRSAEVFQSVYSSLSLNDYAQIMCSTVERK